LASRGVLAPVRVPVLIQGGLAAVKRNCERACGNVTPARWRDREPQDSRDAPYVGEPGANVIQALSAPKGFRPMARAAKEVVVNAPLSAVYNQWTQFEQFPEFMDGVMEVRQLDDKRLHWRAKIGGQEQEWDAEIQEQVP